MSAGWESEQCWSRYQWLVRRWGRRLARRFGGRPSDYWGYLTVRLIRRFDAYYQRAARPYGFPAYFARRIYSNAFWELLRYESEGWAQSAIRSGSADPVRTVHLPAALSCPVRDHESPLAEVLAALFERMDDPATQFWPYLCDGLPRRARKFIERRYRLGHTLRQIASASGLTPEGVRIIIQKTLVRIGWRLKRRVPFLTLIDIRPAEPRPPAPRHPAEPLTFFSGAASMGTRSASSFVGR